MYRQYFKIFESSENNIPHIAKVPTECILIIEEMGILGAKIKKVAENGKLIRAMFPILN